MSPSSRDTSLVMSTAVTCLPWSVMFGRLGRVRVGRRKVGEHGGRRMGGGVHAVADGRASAGVDELGEERVHHVVVQGPTPTRHVLLAATRGELDLEEGTLLLVRLGDVEDEVVRQDQLGQWMVAVLVQRPVRLAVEPVPEGQ